MAPARKRQEIQYFGYIQQKQSEDESYFLHGFPAPGAIVRPGVITGLSDGDFRISNRDACNDAVRQRGSSPLRPEGDARPRCGYRASQGGNSKAESAKGSGAISAGASSGSCS